MNLASDKYLLQQVHGLLAPYARESLSAFDNMKLVIAVISADMEQHVNDSAKPAAIISYQVTPRRVADRDIEHKHTVTDDDDDKSNEQFYCVKWQNLWINCGLTHDHSASIQLLTHDGMAQHIQQPGLSDDHNAHAVGEGTLDIIDIETSALREVHVPVLSLQQIEFMCMEYAHFDHC